MQPKTRFIHPIRSSGGGKDVGLSIIILASAPGYRMKSFGPQCLIKDKYGVSILEHQVSIYESEFNQKEIIIVGGFEIDKLIRNMPKSTRLVENQLFEQSNEVGDVRLAINNAMYDNILLVFGDMYFSPNLIKNLTKKSSLVVDNHNNLLDDDIGSTVVDEHVTIMSLSIKDTKWAKIAYFTDKEAKLLKQFVNNRDNDKLFIFEAINFILSKNGEFMAKQTQTNDILVHVDSTKEIEKIQ